MELLELKLYVSINVILSFYSYCVRFAGFQIAQHWLVFCIVLVFDVVIDGRSGELYWKLSLVFHALASSRLVDWLKWAIVCVFFLFVVRHPTIELVWQGWHLHANQI